MTCWAIHHQKLSDKNGWDKQEEFKRKRNRTEEREIGGMKNEVYAKEEKNGGKVYLARLVQGW